MYLQSGEKMSPHSAPMTDRSELIQELVQLSASGLEKLYDRENNLFCFRGIKSRDALVLDGQSLRYTIISLMGLHRLKNTGLSTSMDTESLTKSLLETRATINSIGDLGLLLWLCSMVYPSRVEEIVSMLSIHDALDKYGDSMRGKTTELAWFLTGLSEAALALGENADSMQVPATRCYHRIVENYGGKGIFGYQGNSIRSGRIRRRIGCFADQVYPIYALCKYARAFHREDALNIAAACGKRLCQLQGPFGQWWWHYDSKTGATFGHYPVFSVHQDGMAPMALFALGEAIGMNFDRNIYEGLDWITGHNEIGLNMIDRKYNMIWRCVSVNKFSRISREFLAMAFSRHPQLPPSGELTALYECRPYHLGWLLYAFAGKYPSPAR